MIDAFYTAAVGVNQVQKNMDVIANNVANSSTDGFKAGKGTFADLLYTNIQASETDTKLKAGHGVKLQKVDTLHTDGGLKSTESPLDFAIVGDGFFAIETTEGTKYTRAGSFHLSVEDDQLFVVNGSGGYLLDANGDRVTVENAESDIDIAVWKFPNNGGLLIEGGLYFNQTERSGEPELGEDAKVVRKFLERSNVDMAQTMADMIQIQRAFQFNSKMVQTADEIMQTVNALR